MQSRLIYLPIIIVAGLWTGCVYYGDLHNNSKQLDTSVFSTHNVYKIPNSSTNSNTDSTTKPAINSATNSTTNSADKNWWSQFNDPQLDQLIQIALADSPDMQIAEARVRVATHLAEGAASARWPTVDFSGYVQEQKFSTYGLITPPFNGRSFGIGDLSFNFNYEFDFWGKYKEAFLARMSAEEAAIADQQQAKLIISASVANTYFGLLGKIEEIKLTQQSLNCQNQIVKISETREEHGLDSDIPTNTNISNLESIKLILTQFQAQESIMRHQLAALLGKNALQTEIQTTKFSFKSHYVAIPEYLPANLLSQRPDIRASRLRAEVEAHKIKVSKSRFFPNINLSAFWSLQSAFLYKLFNLKSQDYAVTGAIDLPIFDAGARRADLATHYADFDVSVNTYNQTIINAIREVADQASTLDSIKKQLKEQEISIQKTRNQFSLFTDRYKHGIINYTPTLEIQQLLILHEIALIYLQTQQLQATVSMFKALGGEGKAS